MANSKDSSVLELIVTKRKTAIKIAKIQKTIHRDD